MEETREYLTIIVDEAINGYLVRGLGTGNNGRFIDEFHETRYDALNVIRRWVNKELQKETEPYVFK